MVVVAFVLFVGRFEDLKQQVADLLQGLEGAACCGVGSDSARVDGVGLGRDKGEQHFGWYLVVAYVLLARRFPSRARYSERR